jgi:hypothetical protein
VSATLPHLRSRINPRLGSLTSGSGQAIPFPSGIWTTCKLKETPPRAQNEFSAVQQYTHAGPCKTCAVTERLITAVQTRHRAILPRLLQRVVLLCMASAVMRDGLGPRLVPREPAEFRINGTVSACRRDLKSELPSIASTPGKCDGCCRKLSGDAAMGL